MTYRNTMFKRIIQSGVVVLTGFFIIRMLIDQWEQVVDRLRDAEISWLIIGVIGYAASFVILPLLWRVLVRQFSQQPALRWAWYSYSRANIIRYIPGNIWGLAAKGVVMTRLGISRAQAVFIIVYEAAVLVAVSLLVFLFTAAPVSQSGLITIGLAVIVLLLVIFVIRPRLLVTVAQWFNRDASWCNISGRTLFCLIAGSVLYWLVSGFSFYCVMQALTDWPFNLIGIALGVYAASWAIGFMSVITPSGVGVREISIVFFLGPFLGGGLAAAIAVIARIAFLFGEILNFFIALFIYHGIKQRP